MTMSIGRRAWIWIGVAAAVVALGGVAAVAVNFATPEKARAPRSARAAAPAGAERLPDDLPGRIAFQSNRAGAFKLFVMDRAGVRQLTDGPGNDMKPAWSPDGRRVAFFSDRDGKEDIYVVDADGRNLRRLTTDPADDREPAWSPDGRRIAFASEREGALNVWTMNADGTAQRRLTNYRIGKAAIPAWSPDGRSIAFVSVRSDGKGDIWVVDPDGGNPRRLTTTDRLYDYHPAWSPDGQRLVLAAGPDKQRYKLFVIDGDGANRRQLTFGDAFDTHPAWTR